MKKKLLLVSLALVIAISVIAVAVAPAMTAGAAVQRPVSRNCGVFCWGEGGLGLLGIDTCNNTWELEGLPIEIDELSSAVRQYGNKVIMRGSGMIDMGGDDFIIRFYFTGVIGGAGLLTLSFEQDGIVERISILLQACQ